MKALSVEQEGLDLQSVIALAKQEPILLLTADGQEFLVAAVDDFDREVEALRASPAFQRFLDERSRSTRRVPLEEIEAEIERELQAQPETS
jgi:hypothetical protein